MSIYLKSVVAFRIILASSRCRPYKCRDAILVFLLWLFSELSYGNIPLEEVTVSARKWSEQVTRVPLPIDVFTAAQLDSNHFTQLDNIEQLTSNLYFDASSPVGGTNAAAIFIRGIGQADYLLSNDPGVGLYVDGIYLGRSFGGSLDTAGVEQVEVIKGPQGTTYGRNTIGGSILVTTAQPKEVHDGYVKIALGSDQRRDYQFGVDLPLIEDTLLSTWTFSRREIDGYTDSPNDGKKQGEEDRYTLRGKLAWRLTEDFDLILSLDGQKFDETAPPLSLVANSSEDFDEDVARSFLSGIYNSTVGSFAFAPDGSDGRLDSRYLGGKHENFSSGPNYAKLKTVGTSINASWQLPLGQLKTLSGYRNLNTEFGRDVDGTPINALSTENDVSHEQYSQELQWQGDSADKTIKWVSGLYYFYETGRDKLLAEVYPSLFSALGVPLSIAGPYKAGTRSTALYSQLGYELHTRINLTAGFRYTWEEKNFRPDMVLSDIDLPLLPSKRYEQEYSEPSTHIGIDYHHGEQQLYYVNYSKSFKSGGYVARYQQPTSSPATFDPERVENIEMGVKLWDSNNTWQLNSSAFYADYDDIQVLVFDGLIPLTENAAAGRVSGLELDGAWWLSPSLRASATVGYLFTDYSDVANETRLDGDEEFPYAPNWTASLGISYKKSLGQVGLVNAHLNYYWRGEMATDYLNTAVLQQDAVGLVNFTASWQPVASNWKIGLYGKNITDERYIIRGSSDIPTFGLSEASYSRGREVGLTLSWNYDD